MIDYDPAAWQEHTALPGEARTAAPGTACLVGLYDRMGMTGYRMNNLRAVQEEIARLGKGASVLDAGCCAGAYCGPLRAAGANYTGIDVTPKFVEEAKRRNPGVPFQVADVRGLPFADKSFDIVYCAGVLEHITEPEAISRELWRATGSTLFLGADVQDVPAPWKDITYSRFVDVWYNIPWLDGVFNKLGGVVSSIILTPVYQHGFYSALWTIRR